MTRLTAIAISLCVVMSNHPLQAQEKLESWEQNKNIRDVCVNLESSIVVLTNAKINAARQFNEDIEEMKRRVVDTKKRTEDMFAAIERWESMIKREAEFWDKLSCAFILYGKERQ